MHAPKEAHLVVGPPEHKNGAVHGLLQRAADKKIAGGHLGRAQKKCTVPRVAKLRREEEGRHSHPGTRPSWHPAGTPPPPLSAPPPSSRSGL